MQHPPLPLTHDLVMIGGGHTHALVLRKWGMNRLAGARLTVIHPGPTAPYSGMLPGYVAGHYDRDALDIDLIRLARFAGARVVAGYATGIDLGRREVLVEGHGPIGYDLLSVNVGVTSDMPSLPGFAEHGVPAKPLGPFATAWAAFLASDQPPEVAVIGGGVAGAELAMAMAYALLGRAGSRVTLVDNAKALSVLGLAAQAHIRTAMDGLGVKVIEDAKILSVGADHLNLSDGRKIASRFTTGTAGARALRWLGDTGLELNDGFITVDPSLRSSDAHVFAAGDCVHLSASPRPKAGVFAVREAPVLYHNLRAMMTGDPLRRYAPQNDYLKLISLGGKTALAEKFGRVFAGPLMWRWKNHIDQTFMQQFRTLPAMKPAEIPALHTVGLPEAIGDKPLCGGCGAKVGRASLRRALQALPETTRADIRALPGDDAALLLTGGVRQVITSDHLRAITHDPALMAHIAAIHALGDIWAMGATPQAALATVILPRLTPALQDRTLGEIMRVAGEVMAGAGAEIVGGHTSVGDEMTIGFTITGLCENDPITLAGAQPGDALILTKPLGSGVLMAAEMAGLARGEWVVAGFEQMTRGQAKAAQILAVAHAMTDVTGFGLAGHLLGMCVASGVGATVDLGRIPTLHGSVELAISGVQSTLFADNRALVANLPANGKAALLFDPQTAGGLLAAVSPDQAKACLCDLLEAGYGAAIIGVLTDDAARISLS
ncbi:MAG: selenide, water dikinase SelD [Rhodobacteraceae bacterium]|nr:selenide, water dikinase SelD [Paracoccaceae bacterium]